MSPCSLHSSHLCIGAPLCRTLLPVPRKTKAEEAEDHFDEFERDRGSNDCVHHGPSQLCAVTVHAGGLGASESGVVRCISFFDIASL